MHSLEGDEWYECYAEHEKKKENYEKQKVQYDADLEIWKLTPEGLTWAKDQERRYVNAWNKIGVPGTSEKRLMGGLRINTRMMNFNLLVKNLKTMPRSLTVGVRVWIIAGTLLAQK